MVVRDDVTVGTDNHTGAERAFAFLAWNLEVVEELVTEKLPEKRIFSERRSHRLGRRLDDARRRNVDDGRQVRLDDGNEIRTGINLDRKGLRTETRECGRRISAFHAQDSYGANRYPDDQKQAGNDTNLERTTVNRHPETSR